LEDIGGQINLYADDTSLHIIVHYLAYAAETLQSDIDKMSAWAEKWLVTFSPSKSESMVISRKINKPFHPSLLIHNQQITTVTNILAFTFQMIARCIVTLTILPNEP
jgi:hypothetical protein